MSNSHKQQHSAQLK